MRCSSCEDAEAIVLCSDCAVDIRDGHLGGDMGCLECFIVQGLDVPTKFVYEGESMCLTHIGLKKRVFRSDARIPSTKELEIPCDLLGCECQGDGE